MLIPATCTIKVDGDQAKIEEKSLLSWLPTTAGTVLNGAVGGTAGVLAPLLPKASKRNAGYS